MKRVLGTLGLALALSAGSLAAQNTQTPINEVVTFTPASNNENSPASTGLGTPVSTRNLTSNSVVVVQVRDGTNGSNGPPIGAPYHVGPNSVVTWEIPNDPALLGFKFEMDPDQKFPFTGGEPNPLSGG